jgi:hypothetical protein
VKDHLTRPMKLCDRIVVLDQKVPFGAENLQQGRNKAVTVA